jgi:hypothetical protein
MDALFRAAAIKPRTVSTKIALKTMTTAYATGFDRSSNSSMEVRDGGSVYRLSAVRGAAQA